MTIYVNGVSTDTFTIGQLSPAGGSPGQVATINGPGTAVVWATPSGGLPAGTLGALVYYSGSAWVTRNVGIAGHVLGSVSGVPSYALVSSMVTASSDGTAMRGALSLGTSATKDVGTGSGQVAAGDAPAAAVSALASTLGSAAYLDVGTGFTSGGGSFSVAYGTGANTSAQGNDGRITGAIQSSVLTANGDLLTRVAGVPSALAVGSEGYVLSVSGGLPTYVLPSAAVTASSNSAAMRSALSLAAAINAISSTNRIFNFVADTIAQADGTSVAAWVDTAGAYTAAQATPASQPVFWSGSSGEGVGGRAGVRFNGAQRLLIPGAAALDATVLTLFLVVRGRRKSTNAFQINSLVYNRPYDLAASSPYSEVGLWVASPTSFEFRVDGTPVTVLPGFPPPTGLDWGLPHIIVLTVGASGTKIYVDGVQLGTLANTSVTYNTPLLNIAFGAGGYTTPSDFWYGDYLSACMFSVQLTPAQRRLIEGYYAAYYGIPVASSDT